jgi:nucleotide-binding universal stress UspA family protein
VKVNRRIVIADDVAATILHYANVEESDLIAIATRGLGAIARARSGSVSDRVMREAPISTMVVHPVMARVVDQIAKPEEGLLQA